MAYTKTVSGCGFLGHHSLTVNHKDEGSQFLQNYTMSTLENNNLNP
jgi:hypothetical protein